MERKRPTKGVCLSEKMTPIYFLRLSKVWTIYITGQCGEFIKKCELMLLNTFLALLFFIVWYFNFFFFFFDKVFLQQHIN